MHNIIIKCFDVDVNMKLQHVMKIILYALMHMERVVPGNKLRHMSKVLFTFFKSLFLLWSRDKFKGTRTHNAEKAAGPSKDKF